MQPFIAYTWGNTPAPYHNTHCLDMVKRHIKTQEIYEEETVMELNFYHHMNRIRQRQSDKSINQERRESPRCSLLKDLPSILLIT